MSARLEIQDLHGQPGRDALLRVNNVSARETSLLSPDRFDQLIEWARVALFIPPAEAFLLAFEQSDDYDGGHFRWFRSRFDKFLYIDRVVVAEERRRYGLGRMLYSEVFRRAVQLGHTRVVCEVNQQPPNPVSDKFHAAQGFEEVGRATSRRWRQDCTLSCGQSLIGIQVEFAQPSPVHASAIERLSFMPTE